ncbi:molybdopterin-converting factor chain 2 [Arenimonas soli]|uniref:Molybdopterin synthase catalytic subunit n=1 Tax=Arenimonas soli TaxID=2269504 RepID=A0ABQ1HCX4_9GAMM|nr:molybdenum cofactor biosynthesis protein MoaE [Arenimonas soli]GGA71626.1 molybdopterin-converting factor chain 2 [Arenimonas soli]
MTRFALSDAAFDPAPLRRRLQSPQAGAFASFEGWVRDHHAGRAVLGLRYEAYAALAEAEGLRIIAEATRRFDIADAACVHRVGGLAPGEMAVWVGVSAAHRGPAFDACRWILDEVKSRVPIWKHERYADGSSDWLHPE